MVYLLLAWLILYLYNLFFIYRNWRTMLATQEVLRICLLIFMDANKTKRALYITGVLFSLVVLTPLLAFYFIIGFIKKTIKIFNHGKN